MKYPFWSALEKIPSLLAFPVTWKEFLGPAFDPFRVAFLRPFDTYVAHYPCSAPCGCLHVIKHRPDGSTAAVCTCPGQPCPDIPLTPADLQPLAIHCAALRHSLRTALSLDAITDTLNIPNTPQIGAWSTDAVPVFLTVKHTATHFRSAIAELVARLQKPFILLGPTNSFFTASCLELLHHGRAEYFPLASLMRLTDSATLVPDVSPGELFTHFNPQPADADQSAAMKLFAIAKSFDTGPTPIKAPPFTVFRLYCIDALSVTRIARRCNCSRPLVRERLRFLKRKLGCHPSQLRQQAATFATIEKQLRDPRARHIHRPAAIDPEENPDEGV